MQLLSPPLLQLLLSVLKLQLQLLPWWRRSLQLLLRRMLLLLLQRLLL